jgi:hypothetical protein
LAHEKAAEAVTLLVLRFEYGCAFVVEGCFLNRWRCFAWLPQSTLRVGNDEERCQQVRGLFVKDQDQAFPLTDCTSFAVMREMGLKDAPTADPHFITMGFNPLLID